MRAASGRAARPRVAPQEPQPSWTMLLPCKWPFPRVVLLSRGRIKDGMSESAWSSASAKDSRFSTEAFMLVFGLAADTALGLPHYMKVSGHVIRTGMNEGVKAVSAMRRLPRLRDPRRRPHRAPRSAHPAPHSAHPAPRTPRTPHPALCTPHSAWLIVADPARDRGARHR